jgi:hypothetical protein
MVDSKRKREREREKGLHLCQPRPLVKDFFMWIIEHHLTALTVNAHVEVLNDICYEKIRLNFDKM